MNLTWTLKESKEVEKSERMKFDNKQNGNYIAERESVHNAMKTYE